MSRGMIEVAFSEWVARLREDSHPRTVMVEVTSRCNLSCIHCFRFSSPGGFRFGDMSRTVYTRIVEEASGIGVRRLIFSGWGEPMVHPDIMWMVEEAKSRGFEVVLNTNGYLLEERAENLWRLGLDEVVVSIDSPNPSLYRKIRRGGELKPVSSGLERLRRLKVENLSVKPRVKIQFTLSSLNRHLIESMVEYAGLVGAYELVVSSYIATGEESEPYSPIGRPEYRSLFSKLGLLAFKANVNIVKPYLDVTSHARCPFVENRALYVRWDGSVAPCINYAYPWTPTVKGVKRRVKPVTFGDLRRDGLRSVWLDERYAKFRFKVKTWSFPSCLDCELRSYCSYTLTNESDCWGNTPTCSHCPYARMIAYCPM